MIAQLKVVAVTAEVAVASAVAGGTDKLAERIVLYSMAATGIAWLWRNFLRPAAKVLHRMAQAVEALEDLPLWRKRTDQRIDRANRRLRHMELGLGQMASGQRAILRELGIENDVRRQFSDPVDFERWLEDASDLEDDDD